MKNALSLLVILYSMNSIHPAYSDISWQDTGKIVASVGAGLLGVGGLIWYLSETDKEIIDVAHREYNQAFGHHERMLESFSQIVGNGITIHETHLNCLLHDIERCFHSFDKYYSQLLNDVALLKTYKGKLKTVLDNLCKHEKTYEERVQGERAESILYSINRFLPKLESYEAVLKGNRYFFVLAETIRTLEKEFSRELCLLESQNSFYSRQSELEYAIERLQHENGHRFVYCTYFKKVEQALSQLKNKKRKVNHYYHDLFRNYDCLQSRLEYLKSFVGNHARYHEELCIKERERLEQERMSLLREEMRIKEKSLKLEKERLERERALQRESNRHNPELNINVDIRI